MEIGITSALIEGPSFSLCSVTHFSTSFLPAVVFRTARTTWAPALASSLKTTQANDLGNYKLLSRFPLEFQVLSKRTLTSQALMFGPDQHDSTQHGKNTAFASLENDLGPMQCKSSYKNATDPEISTPIPDVAPVTMTVNWGDSFSGKRLGRREQTYFWRKISMATMKRA